MGPWLLGVGRSSTRLGPGPLGEAPSGLRLRAGALLPLLLSQPEHAGAAIAPARALPSVVPHGTTQEIAMRHLSSASLAAAIALSFATTAGAATATAVKPAGSSMSSSGTVISSAPSIAA